MVCALRLRGVDVAVVECKTPSMLRHMIAINTFGRLPRRYEGLGRNHAANVLSDHHAATNVLGDYHAATTTAWKGEWTSFRISAPTNQQPTVLGDYCFVFEQW